MNAREASTYVANVPERRFRSWAERFRLCANLDPSTLGVARLDRSGDDVANLVVVLVLIEQAGELGVLLRVLPAHANLFAHDGAANDGVRRPRVGARANPDVALRVDGARAQRLGGDRGGGHGSQTGGLFLLSSRSVRVVPSRCVSAARPCEVTSRRRVHAVESARFG